MQTTIPAPSPMTYAAAGSAPYLRHTQFNVSPNHRNRLAGIVSMLESCGTPSEKFRVLEVGCGIGNICIPLASLGYDITASDIHAPSVELARRKNTFANLTFITEPLERTPLETYDVIILTEVLEHVTGYRDMLDYIVAHMKPAARLLLTVPNGHSLCEWMVRPSYFIKQFAWGRSIVKMIKRFLGGHDMTTANEQTPHVNFFTLPTLERLFLVLGLRVLTFQRCFIYWPIIETFFSERGADDSKVRADFDRSQTAPASRCVQWAFLLEK